METSFINGSRLLERLQRLGQMGRDPAGRLVRVTASREDKLGRDLLVSWLTAAGLEVIIDRIGNIYSIWGEKEARTIAPVMIGSHIDTVVDAGIYDGSYGVLAGLEVIETLQAEGFLAERPIMLAAFTNEEGVRYTPDMMGSLVFVGGLEVEEALASVGSDGSVLGQELSKIGYAGHKDPDFQKPAAYVELHIEQGPILDHEGVTIGAVENLQGISWQKITIEGMANHAGTTPMAMRRDAGYAAAKVITFLREYVTEKSPQSVATVGTMGVEPNIINVIPSRAVFTVDLRNPEATHLRHMELALSAYLEELSMKEGVQVSVERLAQFSPVTFDRAIVQRIEEAAARLGLRSKRMTSGAGHDAQMLSRVCPAAMIFVPSKNGVSHNPEEYTAPEDLIAGANVLLQVVKDLAG